MKWEFNKDVAMVFPSHARHHIPHYEEVIGQSLQLCSLYNKNAPIIDVGVATGETISALYYAGYRNLFGIDNSQDMLDACPKNIAKLICSDSFIKNAKFDVVLMNWTLHFIKDKVSYLKDIYESINNNGALLLTDKMSGSTLISKFYYDMKRSNGLSIEEIIEKTRSLEGVMNLNDESWYLSELKKVGFKKVYVINAYWSFVTFLCFKNDEPKALSLYNKI